jgi:hypothetical protein
LTRGVPLLRLALGAEAPVIEGGPMSDSAQKTHPEELQSDLDLLVEMAKEPQRDAAALRRHVQSLKGKLDKFIHERGVHPDGGATG